MINVCTWSRNKLWIICFQTSVYLIRLRACSLKCDLRFFKCCVDRASTPILPTASQHKYMKYTNCCVYRVVPPDDDQSTCSKQGEVNYRNKLKLNSASCWFLLHKYDVRCLSEHTLVTIRTASLTFSNSLFCPHSVFMCFFCGSENKQRLFPYTALTDWFV